MDLFTSKTQEFRGLLQMCLGLYHYKMFIFQCKPIGERRTGWQGLPRWFFLCSATPPCVVCCTEQKKPTGKPLQARTLFPNSVTIYARPPPAIRTSPHRRYHGGHHCDRRLSPPAPTSANPGLASLSTHPGAALGGLITHGVAGGGR